jgi:hypothetical protein
MEDTMTRKTRLATAVALSLAAAGGAGIALAQPAQPPVGMDGGPQAGPGPRGPMGGPGMRMEHPGPGMWGHREGMNRGRSFGLIHTPADRQLTAADVQTIAQGFLLWHGNHSWKVVDVKEQDDNTISFAFATPSGDVIARFTMDRHTGRPQRVG